MQLKDLHSRIYLKKIFIWQAKTESDKNYLNRKCETLDKQIDGLACLTAGKFTSFTD